MGNAVQRAKAITVRSNAVFGILLLGISPALSRPNIASPGITNVGIDRSNLEKEV